MSDDPRKLKEAMAAVQGHLQDLQAGQKATTQELKGFREDYDRQSQATSGSLKRLQDRSLSMETRMIALGGSFASIDQNLSTLLADHERLEELHTKFSDIVKRVDALEKKAG